MTPRTLLLVLCFSTTASAIDPKREAEEKKDIPVLRELPWIGEEPGSRLARLQPPETTFCWSAAFSPTANLLALGGAPSITLVDLGTGRPIRTLPGGRALGFAFSPNGKRLAAADYKNVRVLDVDTGKVFVDLPCAEMPAGLAFSTDGSTLTVVSASNVGPANFVVTTWGTRGWRRNEIVREATWFPPWALSPDGRRVAYTNEKGTHIVELAEGRKWTARNVRGIGGTLAFHPDGKTLLACTGGEQAEKSTLWANDLAGGKAKQLAEFPGRLKDIRFSPDGKFFVAHLSRPGFGHHELIEWETLRPRWSTINFFRATFSPGGVLIANAQSSRVELLAVDDMLAERWADRGEQLRELRAQGSHVELYGDQVVVGVSANTAQQGIKALVKALPCITHLRLQGVSPLPTDLDAVQELAHLRELHLPGSLDDAKLAPLTGLKAMKKLSLRYCAAAGPGLAILKDMPDLESLDLSQSRKLTDEGLKHLAGLRKLRYLALADVNTITDAGMDVLGNLVELRELTLGSPKITSKGLRGLKSAPHLEKVELRGVVLENDLSFLAGAKELRELKLTSNQLTDAALPHLKDLPALRDLTVGYTVKLTGTGFEALAGLTSLEKLDLYAAGVNDAGLPHLNRLTGLTTLSLGQTKITDNGLKALTDLKKLKKLTLPPAITDAGIEHLAGLKSLEVLDLSRRSKVKGAGLAKLTSLREIRAWDGTINDDGLAGLKDLKSLEELNLIGTKVTAAGLVHLEGLTKLRIVNLPDHASFTPEVLKEIHKKLPNTAFFKRRI